MKDSHGEFEVRMFPIRDIFPSLVNSKVYRPVSLNDPTIQELANSIRKHGIREPLVITKEGDILSGHRRHAAAKLAGLTEAPCRIVNISRDDPEFLHLLVKHNKHRVKSLDELMREAVINTSREQAYRQLIHHRDAKMLSVVPFDLHQIEIRSERSRCAISAAKKPFLDAIQKIINDNRDWWPLSDRQIHYLLVSDNQLLIDAAQPGSIYSNNKKSYKALVEL